MISGEVLDRFWVKIEKTESCWNWIAALNSSGYGNFRIGKKSIGAHRLSYELVYGPIPQGLELDHLCRNIKCVNPAHLEAVTHYENMRRGNPGDTLKNQTHCKYGHLFDEKNTRWVKGKYKVCRECDRLTHNRRYHDS